MGRCLEAVKKLEQKQAAAAEAAMPSAICSRTMSELNELRNEAERIIRAKEEAGGLQTHLWEGMARMPFQDHELAVFDMLAWSNEKLFKEMGRIKTVVLYQSQAGTSEERQAAADAEGEALTKLDNRGPELEKIIADAQRELAGLHRDHGAAARIVEQQKLALERLTKLVPPHVLERSSCNTAATLEPKKRRVDEVQNRLKNIENLSALNMDDVDDRRKAALWSKTWPEAIELGAVPDGTMSAPAFGGSGQQKWNTFINIIQAEVPALENEAALLRSEIESFDAGLNYYAR